MLNAETFWNRESDSEPNLDVQFQQAIDEDDSSDQSTLGKLKDKSDQTSEYFSHKNKT